jgi:NitT/TauT family transport system permease protein
MKNKNLLILSVIIALIFIWFVITNLRIISPLFLPLPQDVILKTNPNILVDISYTLARLFFGFLTAVIIGVPIGLLMGSSEKIYNSLEFLIDFFRSIPATALFPLFLLLFGIGDIAKIAVVAWACTFIIIINTMYGVHYGKQLRLKAAKVMKVKGWTFFTKVLFPESLPSIFTGLRIAISLGLVIVVVTEMFIGTNYGLGKLIMDAQMIYKIPEMFSAIIITGILGFLLNKLFIYLEKRFVHWAGK